MRVMTILCAMLLATPAFAVQSTLPEKAAPQQSKQDTESTEPAAYPADVKRAFLTSCVGLHKEMISPCKCMTLTFERMVPYADFKKLIAMDDPTESPVFTKVVGACLKAQQQQ